MPHDCRQDAIAVIAPFIERWLKCQAFEYDWPGVQYSISVEGKVVVENAIGYANIESGEKLTPQHLMRVASHAKTFTAVAILQLVERGQLRLDDSLCKYLPEPHNVPSNLTVKEALSHSTGLLRDGVDSDYWSLKSPWPENSDLMRLLGDNPIYLNRNTKFKYSNIAYGLLGIAIEKITGRTYSDYVRSEIISPLQLNNTGPDYAESLGEYATGYLPRRIGRERTPVVEFSTQALAPAVGTISTASDLCRFYSALDVDIPEGHTEIINADSKRIMQHPVWDIKAENRAYGLGIWSYDRITKRIGHNGNSLGQFSNTQYCPANKVAISLNISSLGAPATDRVDGMFDLFHVALDLFANRDSSNEDVNLQKYCGVFESSWGLIELLAICNALVGLYPESDNPANYLTKYTYLNDSAFRTDQVDTAGAYYENMVYEFTNNTVSRISIKGEEWLPTNVLSG